MDDDPESLDHYLSRVVRKLVERLLNDERITHWGVLDGLDPASADQYAQLAKIRMAVQVRKALDAHLSAIITYGSDPYETLLSEILNEPMTARKPTWKEIGDALGVSAQAAHRKYGRWQRGDR